VTYEEDPSEGGQEEGRENEEGEERTESTSAAGESDECVLFMEDDCFIIESGCTSHMTGNLDLFENYELIDELIEVQLVDGRVLRVEAKGVLGPFTDVLYIPGLSQNLVSVSQLDRDGYDVAFIDGQVFLHKRGTDESMPIGVLKGKLYHLDRS
jgi:hypothetical protein